VRQGHVPKAESLYLLRGADCIQKRLWVTVPEGVFYLGGSFLGRRLPLFSEKGQQEKVGKQRE